jgi:hypothetical protein
MFKNVLRSLISEDFIIKAVQTILLAAISIVAGWLIGLILKPFIMRSQEEEQKPTEQQIPA